MTKLVDVLSNAARRRVVVVGDVMLDHFLFGRTDRISPEAPVPVVRFTREEYRLGGAANVAHNACALGGIATLVGLVGQDEAASVVRRDLRASSIDDSRLVVDPKRLTTRKVRVVAPRNQQVARIDYEDDGEPSEVVVNALCHQVAAAGRETDAIVLSDYKKGVVSAAVIAAAVAAAAAARVPLLVDPKLPQAERYRGATLITPNHHEAEVMAQIAIRTPDDARSAARIIHERSGANVLITWGEHGMWLFEAGGAGTTEERGLAAAAREVADVTGAGDTVIATLALALASGARLFDAARLANLAAGLVVAKFGPAVVEPDELKAAARLAEQ